VRLGAIVAVGTLGEAVSQEGRRPTLLEESANSLWLEKPLPCVEIAGRSIAERMIQRFVAAGVEDVSVLVTSNDEMPKFRDSFGNAIVHVEVVKDLTSAIQRKLIEFSNAELDHSFICSASAYAETDLLDFFYFHREARQAITQAFDCHGALALWVADCTAASASTFDALLIPSKTPRATYFIREYVNRITHPRDLRQFAEDCLRGRCESRPSGKQARPGVWMDEKADVHRKARIVAPAYIGRGSEIKADAVITRFSTIEKDCCVDCGTVVEDSSILANTNVGIWLDVCYSVVSGNKLFSLARDAAIEISDASIMRPGSGCATNSRAERNKKEMATGNKRVKSKNVFNKERSAAPLWPDANFFPGAGRMSSKGPVIIMELPEQLKQGEVKTFMHELQPLLDNARPCIVLDCSKIQDIDSAGVEMLLQCLELAMKRDGDLKLAAVSPASAIILELMRVDRLFEVFDTPEEATRSFQTFSPVIAPQSQPWYSAGYGLADLKTAN
jgi:anti-sigma B factor antagonist